jgi:hypothetical protein
LISNRAADVNAKSEKNRCGNESLKVFMRPWRAEEFLFSRAFDRSSKKQKAGILSLPFAIEDELN